MLKFILAGAAVIALTANGPRPGLGVAVGLCLMTLPLLWRIACEIVEGFFLGLGGGLGLRASGLFRRQRVLRRRIRLIRSARDGLADDVRDPPRPRYRRGDRYVPWHDDGGDDFPTNLPR
jgi:hypothetical protein